MQIVTRLAEFERAPRLIEVKWAHVGSAYYNGQISLDFAEKLVALNTRVAVRATLTACSLDLEQVADRQDNAAVGRALRLIDLYRQMGCMPVMTCAPYHVRPEPAQGDHLAWCESSAVVYANSVLGARSNRCVEFLDICAAITGRVPDTGLYRADNRRATILISLKDIPARWLGNEVFYQVLGYLVGRTAGSRVPVIEGLPVGISKENLRALGSAAATSGPLSMFHAIGITPEARSLEDACQGQVPSEKVEFRPEIITRVLDDLTADSQDRVTAVCLGAPHFSLTEFEQLVPMLEDQQVAPGVHFYVSTNRHNLAELKARGWLTPLKAAGVSLVADRCTYYRPRLDGCDGVVVTNSAKWAYYAPGNLGARVTLASTTECVQAAVAGKFRRDPDFWSHAN